MPGPLDGLRIIDLSQVIAGPFATSWLADQGADVIKVEDARGDPSRSVGTRKGDMSSLYCAVNRGKRAIVLDLKSDDGKEALDGLLRGADVFIQNFRPGVIERLGFGYERIAKIAPRLIYCSMSGFGPGGPRATGRVYDPIVQAAAGFATQQAAGAGEPELMRTYVVDKTTALVAAQAITAALFARERSGRGQLVSLNMFDAAVAFFWPDGMQNHTFVDDAPEPMPEVGDYYRLWATRDGHVALSSPQQVEFLALARAVGRPEMADDPRFATMNARNQNRLAYWEILSEAVAAWSTDELDARLRAEDAAGGRVNRREDLLEDEQAAFNGTIVEITDDRLGRLRAARHPVRFSDTPTAAPGRPPHFNEHTQEVLREIRLKD